MNRKPLACFILLLIPLFTTVYAVAEGTAFITGGDQPLRAEPSVEGGVITLALDGAHIHILTTANGWSLVEMSGGEVGYLVEDTLFLTTSGMIEETGRRVNLRAAPSYDAEVIGQHAGGTSVRVTDELGAGWCAVEVDGQPGYMAGAFIRVAADALPPTVATRTEAYRRAVEQAGLFASVTKELFAAEEEPAQPDPNGPMIALTFDDGPGIYTDRILHILTQNNAKATFFMVGNRVANYKEVVERVAAQGSEIAAHTWSHPDLTGLSRDGIASELSKSVRVLTAVTGKPVTLMRPPYGSINDTVRAVCKEQGLSLIRWSVDTEDWRTRDADATYNEIMEEARDGSIILCHDIHEATADAMERVIPELIRRGYQLVTVTELFERNEKQMNPGSVYYKVGD